MSFNRFTLFPLKYREIYDFYKKQQQVFWTVEGVDLSSDAADWHKLTQPQQEYLKQVLAFFAASDGIVAENISVNFYNGITEPEVRLNYAWQEMMEGTHSECYSQMIETFIPDNEERNYLFNAIETVPTVKKKAQWALKWITNGSFTEKLIAYLAVEGIFFSGSFAAIFWIRDQGYLVNSLGIANEYINRDENLHAEFACLLYNNYRDKIELIETISDDRIREILLEALAIELEFTTEALPVSMIGMNAELMSQYLKFNCDSWLSALGLKKEFNVANPFSFMETLGWQSKGNFHDKKLIEYQHGVNTEINLDII